MKNIYLTVIGLAALAVNCLAQDSGASAATGSTTIVVTTNIVVGNGVAALPGGATFSVAPNGAVTTGSGNATVTYSTSLPPGAAAAINNAIAAGASNNAGASINKVIPVAPIAKGSEAPQTFDFTNVTVTNALRMNFHDAPLNTVLNYLSARLGFKVMTDTDVHGTATIISEQPANRAEIMMMLSGALAKNGYNVTTNGSVLTITTAESAKTGSQTPVKEANSPADIPENDEIATVILPVQTLNPTQLIKDLDQLVPPGAQVTANEAGNAVIMTARQKDIHRFSEIIKALDSSSVSDVGVFILKYADAKSVATELKEIFQSPDSSVARSDARSRFGGRMFGGGFPGMGGGGDNNSDQKNAADKAVFVSDDQMNAVVASAPPSYFKGISNIISQLDLPSEDITEVHRFVLHFADAQETADELGTLFPDDSSKANDQSSGRSSGFRFFTPPWMQQPSSGSSTSDRMKRQNSVRAVPDMRTHSVLVTASKDQMVLITSLIEDLDTDSSTVKHVHVIDINEADPTTVQAMMTAEFQSQTARAATQSQTSALDQRATATAQQQGSSTTTSGFGSGAGGSSPLR